MIIFVQVPDFYAAVEQVDHPAQPGRPLVVGGDPRKGGTVTSASLVARDAGVVAGMPSRDALELCPTAELRPTRLRRYREVAGELRAILRGVSQRLETEGLEHSYIEAPEGSDPLALAAELCVQIKAETGLRAVAGLGPTRFVAHLAGRHAGRAGVRLVRDEELVDFLAGFPVTEIWGLGPRTAEKLTDADARTIGDLQALPLARLEAIVGARNAGLFRELASGGDRRPLRPVAAPKSLSRETTLESPSGDLRSLGDDLAKLASRVEELLQRERRAARTVSIAVSFVDGERMTRTQTLEVPISRAQEIAEAALQLLGRTQAGVRRVRRLRLQVSNLCRPDTPRDPRQLRLF